MERIRIILLICILSIIYLVLSRKIDKISIHKYIKKNSSYIVTSLCMGETFNKIRPHWIRRVGEKTTNASIVLYDEYNSDTKIKRDYAWWDVIRLKNNISLLESYSIPVVHVDLDLILEKNITEIVNLPYDLIISQEHYGDKAMPQDCSGILGFGVCTGFYIIRPTCLKR